MGQLVELYDGSFVEHSVFTGLFAQLGRYQRELEAMVAELSSRKPSPEEVSRLKALLAEHSALRARLLPEHLHSERAVHAICGIVTSGQTEDSAGAFAAYRRMQQQEKQRAQELKAALLHHKQKQAQAEEQAAHEKRMAELARDTRRLQELTAQYAARSAADERDAADRFSTFFSAAKWDK